MDKNTGTGKKRVDLRIIPIEWIDLHMDLEEIWIIFETAGKGVDPVYFCKN